MKKETKDLLVNMIQAWNQFNPQKAVKAHFDDNEFSSKCWSLDVAMEGVVGSDFIGFLLPAIQVNNCIWFLNAYNNKVILHIQ